MKKVDFITYICRTSAQIFPPWRHLKKIDKTGNCNGWICMLHMEQFVRLIITTLIMLIIAS